MNLVDAKCEIQDPKPPQVNGGMLLAEIAAITAVAILLAALF